MVTAAKFCEYALLAPSLVLLLRRAEDALPLLWSIAAWSAAAAAWALLQFAGVVDEFNGKRPLQREPSFVGIHDLAALSGAALVVALAVVAFGSARARRAALGWTAGIAGSDRARSLRRGRRRAGRRACRDRPARALRGRPGREPRRRRRRRRRRPRRAADANGRPGAIDPGAGHRIGPHTAYDAASYVHRSLLAYIGVRIFADASGRGRRLAGIRGAGELRAVPRGGSPAVPGRAAARLSGARACVGRPERVSADARRPGDRGLRRPRRPSSDPP